MEKKTYKIPKYNLEWLREKVAQLNRKARKVGSREIQINVLEEVVEKHKKNKGFIGGWG